MDRKEQLNDIVRGALFSEVRVLSDGRSIVMDPETERLYYRKRLSVYSIPVFRFLKEHKHKNLPEIHLFWQEEGDLIVIEELIQGHTLEELLDSGKALYAEKGLCFEEKKRILLELCDALEYLHSANPPIIHRDIKASNVMIREDGTLKLIDYDAAKQYVAEKSRDTVLIGTQGIAAPEQYGFAQSDERTDIFALGKLIERLLPESKQA
ncbi:MAG: protein kinase, partial [Eubacterium sp.]|nr:protein kinase [Eubacterium sp.]